MSDIACKHGQLARSCNVCELEATLREREAELAEAVGLLCGAKPPDVCYDVPAWTAARDRLTGVARHPAPARSGEGAKVPPGELTAAIHALTSGPPPGMLCGSRLTDTGGRCLRPAGHDGNHDPHKPEEPCGLCSGSGSTLVFGEGFLTCGHCDGTGKRTQRVLP